MAWYGDGAGPADVPTWVDGAKSEVMAGREWRAIERELRRGINELMGEANPTGAGLFSDLSPDEQRAVVDRAAAALKDSKGYGDLVRVTSRTLNRALNQAVEGQSIKPTSSFDQQHQQHRSKADLCVAESAAAATTLLQRWPDQQGRLAVCLNQQLPPTLRQRAWGLTLLNRAAVAEYIDLYSKGILHVTSPHDAAITTRCELLLNGSPLLGTRIDGRVSVSSSPRVLYGMKAILSFHHVKTGAVSDADYLMAVPFAWVFFGPLVTNPRVAEMATAVSVYRRFLETLPPMVTDGKACVDAVAGVLRLLAKADPDLHRTLSTVPGRGGHGGDGGNGVQGRPDRDIGSTPETGLARLIRPMIATLCVGFVPVDVACFLWDQYMLSNASPRTAQLMVAAVLLAMAEHLEPCATADALVETMAAHAKQLTVAAVQRCVRAHLLGLLQTEVNAGVVPQAFPMVPGPTMTSLPAWSWSAVGTPAPARDLAAAPKMAAGHGDSSIAQSITNAMMMDQSLIDLATTDPAYFSQPDFASTAQQAATGRGAGGRGSDPGADSDPNHAKPSGLKPNAPQPKLLGARQDIVDSPAAGCPDIPAGSIKTKPGPGQLQRKSGVSFRIRRRESRSSLKRPTTSQSATSMSSASVVPLLSSKAGRVAAVPEAETEAETEAEVLEHEVAEMEARRHELTAILKSSGDAAPATPTSGDLANKSAMDIFMDVVGASVVSLRTLAGDSDAKEVATRVPATPTSKSNAA